MSRPSRGAGGPLPLDEALARLGEIVAADNAFDRRLKLPGYLLVPEILEGLGLAAGGLRLELAPAGDDAPPLVRVVPFVPHPEGSFRSLELNPENQGGMRALAQLRAALGGSGGPP